MELLLIQIIVFKILAGLGYIAYNQHQLMKKFRENRRIFQENIGKY